MNKVYRSFVSHCKTNFKLTENSVCPGAVIVLGLGLGIIAVGAVGALAGYAFSRKRSTPRSQPKKKGHKTRNPRKGQHTTTAKKRPEAPPPAPPPTALHIRLGSPEGKELSVSQILGYTPPTNRAHKVLEETLSPDTFCPDGSVGQPSMGLSHGWFHEPTPINIATIGRPIWDASNVVLVVPRSGSPFSLGIPKGIWPAPDILMEEKASWMVRVSPVHPSRLPTADGFFRPQAYHILFSSGPGTKAFARPPPPKTMM